jgi:hypothetical protein
VRGNMDESVKIEYLDNGSEETEIVIMVGQQWSENRINETVDSIRSIYPHYNIRYFDFKVLYRHQHRRPVYCYFFAGSSRYSHFCLARYIVETFFSELVENAKYNVNCYTRLSKLS